jgi:mannan endo-1,4-beta-mannosidase
MTTNHACRLVAAVLAIALLGVSTTIWRSPQARSAAGNAVAAVSLPRALDRVRPERPQPRPASTTRTKASKPKSKPRSSPEPRTGVASRPEARQPGTPTPIGGSPASGRVAQRLQKSTASPSASAASRASTRPRALHCWSFRWQQDAQRAYLANLRDPWGLDGSPGPRNDDGLACTDLRADPRRPPSAPAAPYVEPLPVALRRRRCCDRPSATSGSSPGRPHS